MYGRSYYQFKPEYNLWILAIVARKFAIAVTAVVFNLSVNFQMAACLLIMFLAYAAQVQNRPYMSPSECVTVIAAHEAAAAAGDELHARLRANIAGVESRGRKRGVVRSLLTPAGRVDASAALSALREYAFNFNTVEATMLFCIVVVCLMALMYQANQGNAYYPSANDSITSVVMLTIVFGIVYFVAALGVEVASTDQCKRRQGGDARAGRKLTGRGPSGPVDSSMNPMFLDLGGKAAELGTKDSLVASILAQGEAPPRELWLVFRDEFASTLGSLKEAQAAVTDMKEREQKRGEERAYLEEVGGGGVGGGGGGGGGAGARRVGGAPPMRREFEMTNMRNGSPSALAYASTNPLMRSPAKGAHV
jgi:hypothetical protein